jgi:hypothetical protein
MIAIGILPPDGIKGMNIPFENPLPHVTYA